MILIQKAIIKCPESPYHGKQMDIMIANGLIEKIGTNLPTDKAKQIINHENLHVSLGWIDSNVCIGEPGHEDRQTLENGLKAAAAGGFTHVVLNPHNSPNPESAAGIKSILAATHEHTVTVLPLGNLTKDQHSNHLAELYDMKQAGAAGFYDYKKPIANANLLKIALQYSSTFSGVVQSFPEDSNLASSGMVNEDEFTINLGLKSKSSMAENVQIARDLAVLEYTGGRLHIPCVSTATGVKMIQEVRKRGLNITCSISINNLLLDSSSLEDFNTNYKLLPPLRSESDKKELIKLVKNNVADVMITSDHSPRTIEEKDREFDQASYGAVGLETAFTLSNCLLGLDTSLKMLTAAYGIFTSNRPNIDIGQVANLTLFNPSGEFKIDKTHYVSTARNITALGETGLGKVLGIIHKDKVHLND